jgi:hypothetical protein
MPFIKQGLGTNYLILQIALLFPKDSAIKHRNEFTRQRLKYLLQKLYCERKSSKILHAVIIEYRH